MKMLTLIVSADTQQMLADALRGLAQVQGFTFTHVEGHGTQEAHDAMLSARDQVVGYVPQVRVDILLEEADLAGVLETLRNGQSGLGGRYWVTGVEKQGRL